MVHIAQTNNMQRTRRQSKLKVAAWLKSAVDFVTTEPAVDIVAEPAVDIVTTASRSHLSLNPETGILEYHFADSDSDCGSHVSGTTNGSVVSEIFPVSHLYYHLYMQYLNSLSIMWSGV